MTIVSHVIYELVVHQLCDFSEYGIGTQSHTSNDEGKRIEYAQTKMCSINE